MTIYKLWKWIVMSSMKSSLTEKWSKRVKTRSLLLMLMILIRRRSRIAYGRMRVKRTIIPMNLDTVVEVILTQKQCR